MELKSQNFIKNYFLEKLLDTRLFFIKEHSQMKDFFEELKKVKKVLIILPVDKKEEEVAREFLPEIQHAFGRAKLSTLDLSSIRESDTNWLGVPNQKYLSKIQAENFDLLLDLNGRHIRLCAYLGALSEALMRLHIAEGKFDKIYNLHFRTDENAPLISRYQNFLSNIIRMRKKSP